MRADDNETIEMLSSPLRTIKQVFLKLETEEDFELGYKSDTGILCLRIRPERFPHNHLQELQDHVYKQILTEGQRTISITRFDNKTYLTHPIRRVHKQNPQIQSPFRLKLSAFKRYNMI